MLIYFRQDNARCPTREMHEKRKWSNGTGAEKARNKTPSKLIMTEHPTKIFQITSRQTIKLHVNSPVPLYQVKLSPERSTFLETSRKPLKIIMNDE
jgi:hypothetical protein